MVKDNDLPNEALVLDSPKVDWSSGPEDRRKVQLIIYTTPAQLRMIAGMLEERSEVRVNWYHTRYSFRNEKTFEEERYEES